ncbi:MAG: hypothetical protein HY718_21240 [Planctomycetes bacterium]|nr:hypothetical protein [Planctomycetota bacterium]
MVATGHGAETRPAVRQDPSPPAWLPLQDAVAGEWAEYETHEGVRLRYEVLRISGLGVATQVTTRRGGRLLGQPAKRLDDPTVDLLAAEANRHGASRTAEPAVVEAAGRRGSGLLFEDRWTDEEVPYVRRTWVSREVPFLGVVRMELYGGGELEARLALVGQGSAGSSDTHADR